MRFLYLSAFALIPLFFAYGGFCQPFKLLKDINGGILYEMPGAHDLVESNGKGFFRIGQNYPAGGYKDTNPFQGFWSTDGFETGTIQIKGLAAFEGMDELVKVGGAFFFSIINFTDNTSQLWKSDGTVGGTNLLNSWNVTDGSSYYRIHNLIGVGDLLYFILRTGSGQEELWRSDGTSGGAALMGSFKSIQNLIDVKGTLFFSAIEGGSTVPYHQLWKSNGTAAGTARIKDIDVRGTKGSTLIGVNDVLYFVGYDNLHGVELWKSDGTEAGTELVLDIEPGVGASDIGNFGVANDKVYFFARTTTNGTAFWRTDGTPAGTMVVRDMDDVGYQYSTDMFNVNGILFFGGYDHVNGRELWKSDGTTDGTIMVKDINPGSTPYNPSSSSPNSFYYTNGTLYFAATGGSNYGSELWKSDGTAGGTVMIKDIAPNGGSGGFININGLIVFVAYTDVGAELWKTDGTSGGTVLIKDIVPTPGSYAEKFVSVNGRVYFSANNNDTGPGYSLGRDLYQTDGTTAGTISLAINPSQGGSNPLDMTGHNGVFYISAMSRDAGHELWSGTGNKPSRLKDIYPYPPNTFGNPGSQPMNFKSAGQFLFFSANNGTNGNELWKTDGTEAGTVLVKDINLSGNSDPQNIENINGIVYFSADDGLYGNELWKSDGTEAGTILVKEINPSGNSDPANLINIDGVLYFTANDGRNGLELWKSNGTEAGTVLVRNINAGVASSNPTSLANINGVLFFAADDGVHGTELWKTDGTEVGTIMQKDIRLGNAGSSPASITNLNGVAYFSADDGTTARELWRSNGTTSGTVLVQDIWLGVNGSNPTILTKVGNNILFAANNGIDGNEVWMSNNSLQDARMMGDIEPGATSSDPTAIFEFGSKVLVAATGPVVGNEIWIANIPAEIPTGPEATITAAGLLTICTGQNVLLKANTGTGYTYQWKRAGANIAGALQANFTATLAGYYTVVVTDAGGTSATSEVTIVTVVNAPLANVVATGPLTICAGKNVLLKATTGTGYTYQWKRGVTPIPDAVQSSYAATISGNYTVIVTNATGCSATSPSIPLTVKPSPLATITPVGSPTICSGKNVLLKATTGTNYTYQWKRGVNLIPDAVQSTYAATTSGNYTVIVTNASGCSITSASIAVTINPSPIAKIAPVGSTTICAGKNVLLRASTGTNYSYQWKRGSTPIPDAVQSTYTAATSGNYIVIVTNASGCSVTSASIPVTINPSPIAKITPVGSTTICAGKNVLLKANTGTNYTYQWKRGAASITDALQSTYTATASGNYTVVVTNASGCSVTSASVPIMVKPSPVATITPVGSTIICAGKDVLLKANTGANYTYQWKKNGINITAQTQSNYTATTTGVYTVLVTNADGCSHLSAGTNIIVNPAPAAVITANGPLSFPQGANVVFAASVAPGNIYQWKRDGVNIVGATSESYTASLSGSYTVVITNTSGCQAVSQPLVVSVIQERPITKNFNGGEDIINAYPNPMYRNDYLTIDRNIAGMDKSMLVTIYDRLGRKINSQLLTANERTIKIAGASGMYLVECKWGVNKRKVFSVIKIE